MCPTLGSTSKYGRPFSFRGSYIRPLPRTRSVSEHVPGFFAAYSLHEQGPDLFRAEVEARILARERFSSIAQKTCLSVAAIATYEAIFFNVRDWLDSPSYITHRVIGPKIHEGLKPSDIDVLWKFFGYHGGSLAWMRLSTVTGSQSGQPRLRMWDGFSLPTSK